MRIPPWIIAFPLAAAGFVVVAERLQWTWALGYGLHEFIALVVLGFVVLVFIARSVRGDGLWFKILGCWSAAFLLREIHWDPDILDQVVHVALIVIAVWIFRKRKELKLELERWPGAPWMAACLLTYISSQVIARRAFKFIPGEDALHVPLEEVTETMAHLLFLVVSLVPIRKGGRGAGQADGASDRMAHELPNS